MISFIVKICAILLIIAFIIFPSFRQKFKALVGGFLNVFVEDVAKTPDGAKAVYAQAIEEEQEKYNKAADAYNAASGQKKMIEDDISRLESQIRTTESKCEAAVKAGRLDDAKLYAEMRAGYTAQIEAKKGMLQEVIPMVEQTKRLHQEREKRLRQLKLDAVQKVEEIKTKQQLLDLSNDIDELRADSGTDKLLRSVDDGLRDLSKRSVGASEVYKNKTSTKVAAADERASSDMADSYLAELQKKYGGK